MHNFIMPEIRLLTKTKTLFRAIKATHILNCLIASKTFMVGQLGDFLWLNIHPIPILATFSKVSGRPKEMTNQRTNGPVNAHLISWPSKAQNI